MCTSPMLRAGAPGPRLTTSRPPPPPPPPPENPPPPNPLEPEPAGVEAIVPPVATVNPSIDSAKSPREATPWGTYHAIAGVVVGSCASDANASAHFSVSPNTIA